MGYKTQQERMSEREIVTTDEKVNELAEGLESLATYLRTDKGKRLVSLLELRPGAPVVEVDEYFYKAGDFTAAVKVIGNCDKSTSDYYFTAERFFGPYVKVNLQASRSNVCTRKQIGTETVTRKVPDPDVPMVEVTDEKPIYEYDCPPAFLGIGDGDA